MSLERFRNK